MDYPSAPREPLAACTKGCQLLGDCKLYSCTQKACGAEGLCIGCIWQCADCQDDFCEQHIVDLNESGETRWSVYVCERCFAVRRDKAAATPARLHHRKAGAVMKSELHLQEEVRMFHAGCGGIVIGPLDRLVCAECRQQMTAFVSADDEAKEVA
jgi:hypothetical protein